MGIIHISQDCRSDQTADNPWKRQKSILSSLVSRCEPVVQFVSCIHRVARSLDWMERWVRSSCRAWRGEFIRKMTARGRPKSGGRDGLAEAAGWAQRGWHWARGAGRECGEWTWRACLRCQSAARNFFLRWAGSGSRPLDAPVTSLCPD